MFFNIFNVFQYSPLLLVGRIFTNIVGSIFTGIVGWLGCFVIHHHCWLVWLFEYSPILFVDGLFSHFLTLFTHYPSILLLLLLLLVHSSSTSSSSRSILLLLRLLCLLPLLLLLYVLLYTLLYVRPFSELCSMGQHGALSGTWLWFNNSWVSYLFIYCMVTGVWNKFILFQYIFLVRVITI